METRVANALSDTPGTMLHECYVCTESHPVPPKSACQCIDRYIHDACLVKMIETTLRFQCPVCAVPYANVSSRIDIVGVAPCGRGGTVIGAGIVATILLGCAINTWNAYLRNTLSGQEDFVIFFSGILMTVVCVACIAYVGRECLMVGPWDIAQSILLRKRKVFVMPREPLNSSPC